ncbi:hypothetical protein RvY_06742 [Ramazzottius varieornatus]|uniref:Uncharacterized protein n=1 Tax=Ramazzottius varieornatus TaxID=947166 RepID=A0A1D1UZL9_RAMVA|nr:hypothetical protein RvY_06742 [Ramazzottius varieornatus]
MDSAVVRNAYAEFAIASHRKAAGVVVNAASIHCRVAMAKFEFRTPSATTCCACTYGFENFRTALPN